MKKIVGLLLATVLVLGSFVGCSKTEEKAGADTAKEPVKQEAKKEEQKEDKKESQKKTEIRYAYWGDGNEAFVKAIVEAFETKNPDIDVIIEALPWSEYWTKLEASAMGGAMPDVFIHHPKYIQQYVDNDLLVPVDDLQDIDSSFTLENYPKATVAPFLFNDRAYGIPKDFDTIGLFYNKTIFDKAGLDYPDATWTWDKVVEVAKQLTDKENDMYGFGAYITPQQGYYNTIMQSGGYVVTPEGESGFNTPEAQEGIRFFHDMIYKHEVSPTAEQFSDTSAKQMFSSGKIAMMFAGSWNMDAFNKNDDIKGQFDIAELPAGPAMKATMTNSICFSIAKSTEHTEEARRLVAFLSSEESQSLEASFGGAIPAYKGTASKWVDTYGDYNAQVFIDSLEFAYPLPRTKNTNKWYSVVKDYVRLMISDQMSVEEGCTKLYEEMTSILAEE